MSADIDRVFRVGDVVRAYGVPGPRMVVSKIVTEKGGVLVRCFWFNRRNEFTGQDFGPSFLCKASPWVDRPPGAVLVTDEGDIPLDGEFDAAH